MLKGKEFIAVRYSILDIPEQHILYGQRSPVNIALCRVLRHVTLLPFGPDTMGRMVTEMLMQVVQHMQCDSFCPFVCQKHNISELL